MILNIRRFTEYWVIICALAISGSAISTTKYSNWTIPLLLITFALLLLLKPKQKMGLYKISICGAWLLIGMISTLANVSSENVNAYIHMTLVLVDAILISQRCPLNEMISKFIKVMRVITVIAIVMFVITVILGINPPLPELNNFNGVVYQTGIIWNRYRYTSIYSPRIISIFWEPGLYASYLCISLFFEFLDRKIYNLKDIVLFIIALLLTQSAAGYLLLCIVLFIPVLNYRGKWKKLLVVLLGFMTVFTAFFSGNVYTALISSNIGVLQKFDLSEGTGASRILSLQANLAILADSPLVGHGLAGASNLYSEKMIFFDRAAQTSTSFFYMAAFGVLGAYYTLIFIVSILNLFRKKMITGFSAIVIEVIVLLIINKEPHTLFLFTYASWCYLLNSFQKRDHSVPSGSGSSKNVYETKLV
ncbi:MAG: O-antigen ligase family protein [Eubacterium sp.]|nr:O-antigen ligase family protein [Eubacterium sp.]